MSESNQRSKTLIRELYELSESGALDQMDSKVVDSACDFIQNFINPVVSYKQAAKISGKSLSSIYNKISRSGITVVQREKGIRFKDLIRIRNKEV